jgi:hypothetical protein
MNRHELAEERSRVLHTQIAAKLRQHPELWALPEANLQRWVHALGTCPALLEWQQMLRTLAHEAILTILESPSAEACRLRSSSPFTGILSPTERTEISNTFAQQSDLNMKNTE